MRVVTILLLMSLNVGAAPLTVQLHVAKETYLVYEPIPVTISIRNFSSRTIQLEETDQQSWLDFLVLDEHNSVVRALNRPVFGQPVLLPPGETVSQTIDVLPLYELRERGAYRLKAIVKTPLGNVETAPVTVMLTHGRELWSQTVGLPAPEGTTEDYRTYALLARRGPQDDSLFVSVRDDAHDIVYSLVALGSFLSNDAPKARIDHAGNLHVFFQNGPRSFGYVAISPAAKVLARAAYSDYGSNPTLTANSEGEVSVTGGEQTYPKVERIMTENELNPPPPPAPKPKRHWWWPFGPRA